MCGQGIHRVEVLDDNKKYCYMDYFCGNDFCDCQHGTPGNWCNCPLEEDEDD